MSTQAASAKNDLDQNVAEAQEGLFYTSYIMMGVESPRDLKKSWSTLQIVGLFNVILGILCLAFPISATSFVAGAIVVSVIFGGVVNLTSVCFTLAQNNSSAREMGRSHFLWIGVLQILLGLLMAYHPFATLNVLTIIIAVFYMLLGVFQLSVAYSSQHENTSSAVHKQRYFLIMVVSGVLAIVLSVFIVIYLPVSSWFTVGMLTGANLVNLGCNRIVLAYHGRMMAREEGSSGEGEQLLPDAERAEY